MRATSSIPHLVYGDLCKSFLESTSGTDKFISILNWMSMEPAVLLMGCHACQDHLWLTASSAQWVFFAQCLFVQFSFSCKMCCAGCLTQEWDQGSPWLMTCWPGMQTSSTSQSANRARHTGPGGVCRHVYLCSSMHMRMCMCGCVHVLLLCKSLRSLHRPR